MVGSDFVNRVSAYPLVASAYQQAYSGLTWATDRSSYAKAAAGLAENGLRRVAEGAGPILSRYEDRVTQLDGLACRQLLDRLETVCPTVLDPTEEVVKRGKNYYAEAVKPRVDLVLSPVTVAVAKAESVKSASLQSYRRAVESRAGQTGLRSFDRLIRMLGEYADGYLPPTEDEKQQQQQQQAKEQKKDTASGREVENNANGRDAAAEDAEDEEGGTVPPATPAESLAMAYELGRRLGLRATDRLAGQAGRLNAAGHRWLDWLLGRSRSGSSSSTVTSTSASSDDAPPSSSSDGKSRPSKASAAPAKGDADDENADESVLEQSDMSTD